MTLWKLRFPAALPQILTGLRIAGGLAVIGAIVGEFIGGQGLGSVVDIARTQQRTDKVFAAVLLASLLGLALFGFINLVSALVLRRWHVSEQTDRSVMIGSMNSRAAQLSAGGPAAGLLAACGKTSKIRLALNWKPDPEFGGFYAADYAKHGLDVEILPGGAGTPDRADDRRRIGRIRHRRRRMKSCWPARRGNDVVALFAAFQNNPHGHHGARVAKIGIHRRRSEERYAGHPERFAIRAIAQEEIRLRSCENRALARRRSDSVSPRREFRPAMFRDGRAARRPNARAWT